MKVIPSVVLLLILAVPAFAQQDWSSVASAGEVDPTSVAHSYAGAGIRHAGAATGVIVARYNVTNTYGSASSTTPPWTTLRAAIADNSLNATVRVRLVEVKACSDYEVTLCALGSSDVAGTQCPTCTFTTPLDFSNYEYYVEVLLYRNAVVAYPTVYSVSLF